MQVSVVVPTFNRREIVLRTIKTLFAQDFPAAQYEIIVVVDGSTDESAAALRALHPACRFRVIAQENRGLAGARNTGFRAAESELIIFLDDDMLCDSMLVREHCVAHLPNQAAIGFGAIFLSPDSPPSLAAECFNREVGAYYLRHKQNPETPWPRSACVFGNTSIPRKVLIGAGGFDERFRMREDAELGARLLAAGVEPRYVPTAVAYQSYRKAAGDLIRDAQAFALSDRLFLREHPELAGETFLGRIANEPRWKRAIRRTAAACPAVADVVLAPFCWLGEASPHVKVLRDLGVRALQLRRGIHWYRKALSSEENRT
jgi:glycosyltransferase involved in cell wall biosynthesis